MSDFPPNCDECEQCESWTKRNRLKNWYEGDENEKEESIDRSSSDLELVLAAYPDDTSVVTKTDKVLVLPSPLFSFTLHLPDHRILSDTMHQKFHDKGTKSEATLTMTMPIGYPCHRPMIIDISSSSSLSSSFQLASLSPSFSGGSITMGLKVTLEAARNAANEVFTTEGRGEESGLACCEAALGEWITYWEELKQTSIRNRQSGRMQNSTQSVPSTDPSTISGRSIHDEKVKDNGGNCSDSCGSDAKWITAEDTIVDKKSIFRAHLCAVQTEEQVQRALSRLPLVHPKVNKATHNMYAYRFTDPHTNILKHDNDDDGEKYAGSRLAELLHLRKDDGVLVVVSRWYGGTLLGPRRFAHISEVARALLVKCQEEKLRTDVNKSKRK